MRRSGTLLLLCAALMAATLPPAGGYTFNMVFQTKCVMEEAQENQKITGSYSAFHKENESQAVSVDARFENPGGHVVFESQNSPTGNFEFVADSEGDYKLCFTAKDYQTAQQTAIKVNWKAGIDATDWEAVAKSEHLNSVGLELRKLEEVVRDIQMELQYIRRKEEQMRDINEATNARVAWLSVGALVMCILLAAWQLWHLQKFLKRKKVL